MRLGGSAAGDTLVMNVIRDDGTVAAFNATDAGEVAVGLGGSDVFFTGLGTLRRAGGGVVRFDYELRDRANGYGTADGCFLSGFVRSSP